MKPRLKRIYEKDETSRLWFDPSRVTLEMVDDVSLYFSAEDLIDLSGPLSDSTVRVTKVFGEKPLDGSEAPFEAIRLQVHHPAVFSMVRFVRFNANGEASLENAKFRIRADYARRQLAARSLTLQARAAQELGFKDITLDAVGDYTFARLKFPDDRWAGYWVWPRMGFDSDIPLHVLPKLSPGLQSCRRVGELIATDEGLNEWELHGDTLYGAKFDLTLGSMSWRRLAQYSSQRNIKV